MSLVLSRDPDNGRTWNKIIGRKTFFSRKTRNWRRHMEIDAHSSPRCWGECHDIYQSGRFDISLWDNFKHTNDEKTRKNNEPRNLTLPRWAVIESANHDPRSATHMKADDKLTQMNMLKKLLPYNRVFRDASQWAMGANWYPSMSSKRSASVAIQCGKNRTQNLSRSTNTEYWRVGIKLRNNRLLTLLHNLVGQSCVPGLTCPHCHMHHRIPVCSLTWVWVGRLGPVP